MERYFNYNEFKEGPYHEIAKFISQVNQGEVEKAMKKIEDIQKATGLSIEELKKLKENNR